jgi:hypothetical protein
MLNVTLLRERQRNLASITEAMATRSANKRFRADQLTRLKKYIEKMIKEEKRRAH